MFDLIKTVDITNRPVIRDDDDDVIYLTEGEKLKAICEEIVARRDRIRKMLVASSMSIYGEGAYRTAGGEVVYPTVRAEADLQARRFELEDAEGNPLELVEPIRAALASLALPGLAVEAEKVVKRGVAATQFYVGVDESEAQPQRGLAEVTEIVERGEVASPVKQGGSSRSRF